MDRVVAEWNSCCRNTMALLNAAALAPAKFAKFPDREKLACREKTLPPLVLHDLSTFPPSPGSPLSPNPYLYVSFRT